MNNNNDKLFFQVWRNIYINKIIFNFVTDDVKLSQLLPNYKSNTKKLYRIDNIGELSSFYLNMKSRFLFEYYGDDIGHFKRQENEKNNNSRNRFENKYFKFDQIKIVWKMVKWNKELLRYKVSRGDLLVFSQDCEMSIFSNFKDQSLDIQFYNDLFKNYEKYFTVTKHTLIQTLENIIQCDCLVALKVLVSLFPHPKLELEFSDYKNSILIGSIDCAKYLESSPYNFKLELKQEDINKMLVLLLVYSNIQNIKPILDVHNDYDYTDSDSDISMDEQEDKVEKEIDDEEEDDDEMEEETDDEMVKGEEYFTRLSKKLFDPLACPRYNVSDQQAEFGYKLTSKDVSREFKKVKSLQYLSSIGIVIPDESIIDNDIYKTDENIKKITSVINFGVEKKPLQFILDVCYTISYLEPLLKSFQLPEIFENYLGKNAKQDNFLSKSKLDEIKSKFTSQELSTNLEQLESIDEIKQLVLMAIMFSTISYDRDLTDDIHIKENIYFYCFKFDNLFNRRLSTNSYLHAGIYKFVTIGIDLIERSRNSYHSAIFRFVKDEPKKQLSYVKDFVNDVINSSDGGITSELYYKKMKNPDDIEKLKSDNRIAVFYLLVNFGNIQLLEFVINQLQSNESGIQFLNSNNHSNFGLFETVPTVEIFDLLYGNQYLKQHFNFSKLLNHVQINAVSESIGLHAENNTSKILIHFKLNYQINYLECIKELVISLSYFSNDFIFNNFQDFKIKLQQVNFWQSYLDDKGLKSTGIKNGLIPESLPLWIFIKLMEIKPVGQKYSTFNNPEILSWVIKFRNQDLLDGKCEPVSIESLFNYFVYTNQLPMVLDQSNYKVNWCTGKLKSNEDLITILRHLLLNGNVVKNIIKYYEVGKNDDLNTLVTLSKTLSPIKNNLLSEICRNNCVPALEYIFSIDNNYLFDDTIKFVLTNYLEIAFVINIPIVDYLVGKITNVEIKKVLNQKLYWVTE